MLRRNPKLREHERTKIFDFLTSDQSKLAVKEAESRFEQ